MRAIWFLATCFTYFHLTAVLAETRVALVVGNNNYQELPQLQKSIADADGVASVLKDLRFNNQVVVHDQTGVQIRSEIAKLRAAIHDGDVVFIYFAGHGVAIDGINYWVGTDMPLLHKKSLVKDEAIGFEEVIDPLKAAGARTIIIVSDACRENPFKARGVRGLGSDSGLARVAEDALKPGVALFFSAGPGEQALDYLPSEPSNPNSVYTSTLLKLLKEPGLNHVDIGKELYKRVALLAKQARDPDGRPHEQHPDYTDRVDGYLVFTPGAKQQENFASNFIPQSFEDYLSASPFPRSPMGMQSRMEDAKRLRMQLGSKSKDIHMHEGAISQTLTAFMEDHRKELGFQSGDRLEHHLYPLGNQFVLGKSVAVYGGVSKAAGSECHGCSVTLSFFEVVKEYVGTHVGSLGLGIGHHGSWGNAPEMNLLAIGPDRYGILISEGETHFGNTEGFATLVIPVGGSFFEVLSERISANNAGDGTVPLDDWETKINFYPQNGYFFDVVLDRHGKMAGTPYQEKVTLRFDAESAHYVAR